MNKVLFLYFLLLPIAAFAQPLDSTKEAKEIEAVLMKQAAAWNKGDIAGYMEGYWNSDSLLFTSGGKTQRGWNATFEKYKASYNTNEKMGTLKFSQLEFNMLSETSVWVFGRWELVRENDRPEGLFTLVLRKFPDGWKVVHDHTSLKE